ncbi:hypothetical protein W97_08803 [Coniosporium apollinis CBS 100218]|uniref:Uncharacterized protein n=1 Tax=Coniosporium apollinis (strain CBS 100218) TaxID=1168221 RepID=R7Z605_CONA1|nr:uncharacterized protein W97_08803 [Coniosporium apollinis CBS 100218]EON69543.1 hypothetical protein W97_08803 [Coniosporium apollinis CBS 100218]
MCRAEVYELEEAPSSDESDGEEQVLGYSAATDGVRATLARDNVRISITDATFATLYYDQEWIFDLWDSVDDTVYESLSWDDAEHATILIGNWIHGHRNNLPVRLYDELLDVVLRRSALRDIGPTVAIRRWIRSIVEYLRDRDFENF